MTGLEPATLGVTGRYSNQLSYTRIPLSRLANEHRRREGGLVCGPAASVKRDLGETVGNLHFPSFFANDLHEQILGDSWACVIWAHRT